MLVEDDDRKLERLTAFLRGVQFIDEVSIARSYKTALRAVIAKPPHILILDMSLPNFDVGPGRDPGRPHNLGGREIMRQMQRRGIVVPTIIITQFDIFGRGADATSLTSLTEELQQKFPASFVDSVYYHATLDDWKSKLNDTLQVIFDGH